MYASLSAAFAVAFLLRVAGAAIGARWAIGDFAFLGVMLLLTVLMGYRYQSVSET